MAIPSQQIGWSQKSKLLWNIAKQLETLTKVAGNVEVGPGPGPSTTTTTTTVAPGPTPSFTGTIGVTTVTPGNEQFRFSMSARNLGPNMNVTVNWGDNTSDTYSISNSMPVQPYHNYNTNAVFTVTLTIDNPTLLDTINIDRNYNESGAIVTAYDFGDFNGIAQLVASNSVLHTADTAGLSTLNILQIQSADLESLALVNAGSLQTLYAQNNNLSVLDLTSATVLSYADLSNNELVGLDIDNAASLIYLDLSNNALAEPNVDSILLALVANNQTNGTVNLTGVANDAPSSTGLSAKATLEARGWTVSVNTSSTINTKLLYFKGLNAISGKNALFINDYYFNNNVNIYRRRCINQTPKTVYYVGAFEVGTTLYTDPGLTQFAIPQGSNWNYQAGVLVDVTLNEDNVPGDISIYQFAGTTGVILDNLGTIANSTYTIQTVERGNSSSEYCDSNNWSSQYVYYPPGQNGPVVGGYAHSEISCEWGEPGNNQLAPVFRQIGGTTLYFLDNSNTGLIINSGPCTYIPTWNATWGATAQDAIDGANAIAIKPQNGTSMLDCVTIRKADNTAFDGLPNPFYIAYDGLVRAFYNSGIEGYWASNTPLQQITPPATPYSYQVLQTSCCSCFNDPDPYWQNQKFTVYSNFASPGRGTPIYTNVELTTPLNIYTYYTNGSAYFNNFDWQWVYIYEPC